MTGIERTASSDWPGRWAIAVLLLLVLTPIPRSGAVYDPVTVNLARVERLIP